MTFNELNAQFEKAQKARLAADYEEAERLLTMVLSELDQFPDLATSDDARHLRAHALVSLAKNTLSRGFNDASLQQGQRALHYAKENAFDDMLAEVHLHFGIAYSELNNYSKAFEHYNIALALFETLGNKVKVSWVLGNTGVVHYNLGSYDIALQYFIKSLAMKEEREDMADSAGMRANIGNVYHALGNNEKALEYQLQSLAILEELGEKREAALIRGNIGVVYVSMNDLQNALVYLSGSLRTHIELKERARSANNLTSIGKVYYSLGSFDKALEYYHNALAVYEEMDFKKEMANVYGALGGLYATKEFDAYDIVQAEEYFLKTIALKHELGTKQLLYFDHKALADLYKQLQRWEEFAIHVELYHELEKEERSEEARKSALQMEHRRSIAEREKEMELERMRASAEKNILNNILPEEITQRLIKGENPIADHFDCVSVLFMDIVDFTPLASSITAQQLVHLLNALFSSADGVMREFGMEKIKTIGDAYMAVAGAPRVQEDHAQRAAHAALKLMEVMDNLVVTFPDSYGDRSWIESIPEIKVRIGLHCGPVAAGVVGENKFLYDLWGDAVNTASRMESHGEAGKIHVSEEFVRNLTPTLSKREGEEKQVLSLGEDLGEVAVLPRGEMHIKGKGMMKTYYLQKANL